MRFKHDKLWRPMTIRNNPSDIRLYNGESYPLSNITAPRVTKGCGPNCEIVVVKTGPFPIISLHKSRNSQWSLAEPAYSDTRHGIPSAAYPGDITNPDVIPNLIWVEGTGQSCSMAMWEGRWYIAYGVLYEYPRPVASFPFREKLGGQLVHRYMILHNILGNVFTPDPWVPSEMSKVEGIIREFFVAAD